MMLGLSLIPGGIVTQSGGLPSPQTFFPVAWYDPMDLSTLFQDAAGTVPVTSDGDPVGLLRDKSGNGWHMSQATSSKRPIFHESGGRRWIESDGSGHVLAMSARFGLSANPALTIVAALRANDYAGHSAARLLHIGTPGQLGTLSTALGTGGISWRHNDGKAVFGPMPINVDSVISWTRTAGSNYGAAQAARDGVTLAQTLTSSPGLLASNIGNYASLFSHGDNTSEALSARLYGLVMLPTANATSRKRVEVWLAQKANVTLI